MSSSQLYPKGMGQREGNNKLIQKKPNLFKALEQGKQSMWAGLGLL